MELIYQMSDEAFKGMLKIDGIKNKQDVIDYINSTYGLLGTVVDIAIER